MEISELTREKAKILAEARRIINSADQSRGLRTAEQARLDPILKRIDQIDDTIFRLEELSAAEYGVPNRAVMQLKKQRRKVILHTRRMLERADAIGRSINEQDFNDSMAQIDLINRRIKQEQTRAR